MTPVWAQALVPSHMQCALNGRWEHALVIDPHNPLPVQRKFNAWCGQIPDFALKVFFQTPAGNRLFAGARFNGWNKEALYGVLCAVWRRVETSRASGLALPPAQLLGQALALPLFSGGPQFLEIGVNNQWKSVGSCTLWKAGQAPVWVAAAITRMLAQAPQLLAPQSSNVMLELAYGEPLPHWLGVEISKPAGSGFRLSLDLLDHCLQGVARPQVDW